MPQEELMHPGLWADRIPEHRAIIEAETGRVVTFAEFEAMSNRVAHLARSLDLRHLDQVTIMMENRFEFLPWVWGFMRAGLRVTPIPTHLSKDEIEYILRDSGSRLHLTSAKMSVVAGGLNLSSIPEDARLMADGAAAGFSDFNTLLENMPDGPIEDQYEGITMLYSSGTTGNPKGVRKPLPETPFGIAGPMVLNAGMQYRLDENSIYIHPSPMYHAAPLNFSLRVLRMGGTVIVCRKFDPEFSLAMIEKYRASHSQWVPTHFIRMLRLPQDIRDKYDVSSMKCAIHAAAPCPQNVKRAMIDWWGPVIEEYYAGSEANGQCFITSAEWLKKPGSVGRAIGTTIHICDEDGTELPAGETGTIFFEGGRTFEYHNDPGKTAASRHPKGWSTIGDVGYLDEDGYLFLTDRKTFMIISGGVNIYPQEIENCLYNHPAIDDVAVFGVPNEEFGEEVKAVVQLRPGHTASDAVAHDIIAFCRDHLSHVKSPRSVDFIDAMPRGDNGKLYKKKLRDPYWSDSARLASGINPTNQNGGVA